MILITSRTNRGDFFEARESKKIVGYEYDLPIGRPYLFVCRKPKVPAEVIWSSMKFYR